MKTSVVVCQFHMTKEARKGGGKQETKSLSFKGFLIFNIKICNVFSCGRCMVKFYRAI